MAWGDYDNDGHLDIILTGAYYTSEITKVYHNANGNFVDTDANLPRASYSDAAWGDYDNDGDLDIVLAGSANSKPFSEVYRNEGGTFVSAHANLHGLEYSSVAWGDYDKDGDLDLLLTGQDDLGTYSLVYRNHLGTFTDAESGLYGVADASAVWGDYDGNGSLDILMTGSYPTLIYHNDRTAFLQIDTNSLEGSYQGSAAWGDYDNDGDLDILLNGLSNNVSISKIYDNNDGRFVDIVAGLAGVKNGDAAWGDYDNDGDLDILLTGIDASSKRVTKIYRNNIAARNTVPTAPTNLTATITGNTVYLGWNSAVDQQTVPKSLTYNVRLGKLSNSVEKVSPMAEVASGYRRVPSLGNTNHLNNWTIKDLEAGTYYWSVQAIDNAFAGSVFSAEQIFSVPGDTTPPAVPQMLTLKAAERFGEATLSWKANTEADLAGYRIYRSNTSPASSFLAEVGPGKTSYNDTGLEDATTYYYRIKAVDYATNESNYSNEVSGTPPLGPFSEISGLSSALTGVSEADVAWGDYDDDGDLDIFLTGDTRVPFSFGFTALYRNLGGRRLAEPSFLLRLMNGSVAWGDYDNDGDLDILLNGDTVTNTNTLISKIYRNDPGRFVDIDAPLLGVVGGAVAWGDYDNDGDLDALVTGTTIIGAGAASKIYRNDDGVFVDAMVPLPNVWASSVAWGDYDKDGDMDLLMSGFTSSNFGACYVLQNTNGRFATRASLAPVYSGSLAWGDYDSDGDLDILLTGASLSTNGVAKVYQNTNSSFTDIGASLQVVQNSSAAWGDYDNDGDLDILITGWTGRNAVSKIYRNENSSFVDIEALLTSIAGGRAAWGDYDNDQDLDIVLTGYADDLGPVARVFRNNTNVKNTIPTSPSGLLSAAKGDSVVLTWDRSTDDYTTQSALTYNLRLGTTPGGTEIVSPMADANGYRKLPQLGNTNHNTSWTIKNLQSGTYYWSVQAIDNAFAGSEFAPEQSFAINAAALVVSPTSFNFGNIAVGDSLVRSIEIRNTGTDTLIVSSIHLEGNNTDQFNIVGATRFRIEPNGADTLVVRFKPSSAGHKQASLIITHNAAGNSTTVSLSGNQGAPTFQMSTNQLEFGAVPVGSSLNDTLMISNSGSAALSVTSISITGANANEFTIISSSNFSLEPDDNAPVVVRFHPAATGVKTATLAISHNASGNPSTVNLNGTGVEGTLSVDQLFISFTEVNIGESVNTTVTIRNLGSASISVIGISLIGKDSTSFSLEGMINFDLPPNQGQSITVRFQPFDLGSKNAQLKIDHDAPGGTLLVNLNGRGVDVLAPQIESVNADTLTGFGSPITVIAVVSDNHVVAQVRLLYREGGKVEFISLVMSSGETGYQGIIPAAVVGARGVEFQIEAIDSSSNFVASDSQSVRVRLPDKLLSRNHLGGSAQTAYRMISFPLTTEDASVSATLLDDLGPADTTRWRLWDLDPQNRESQFPYREYPNVGDLAPGKTMFLIAKENKMLTSSAGVTVETLTQFQISLQPGWNMIASPFNFEIPIQNVQPESLRKDLYTYNGVWQSSPSKLQPWEGYMIKAKEAVALTIQPSENALSPLAKSAFEPDWFIQIRAACENARDDDNFAGVIPDAAVEWDRYERFEPPPIGEYVMVSFSQREWRLYSDVFTTDFRPSVTNGQSWEFSVTTNLPGKPVTLHFDALAAVPSEFEIKLIDLGLRLAQDLRRDSLYVYRASRAPSAKEFRLLVGRAEFITEHSDGIAELPSRFEMTQNFPNPFNPSTSIKLGLPQESHVTLKVYDVLGQEIVTLWDEVEKHAGYHVAIWEGRDKYGNPVPSGIYFYRLRVGKHVWTKKMTLIK